MNQEEVTAQEFSLPHFFINKLTITLIIKEIVQIIINMNL